MSINIMILKSFLGKENPILLRIRETPFKAMINFGEIRLPKDAIKIKDFNGLEKEYDCIIDGLDDKGAYIFIKPRFVKDLKMLCSEEKEHLERLKDWYVIHGAHLIKYLLRGDSDEGKKE